MPKISCIMPVYNTVKYLDEAIKSILDQTFSDFEFIISDDGSTDWSKEIIKKYVNQDKRIVFLDNEINRWICANLNDMIKIAKWEYIAIMESDDVAISERFENIMNEFYKDPQIDLIWTQWELIDNNGIKIEDFSDMNYDFSIFKKRYLFKYTFSSPSVIFKKNIIESVGWFESNLLWDFNFYSRVLFNNHKALNIHYKWIKKREHPWSLNARKFYKITDEYLKLRIKLIKEFNLLQYDRFLIIYCYIMWWYYYISWTAINFAKKLWRYNYLSPLWRKYVLRNK